jgi:hypothetical protein
MVTRKKIAIPALDLSVATLESRVLPVEEVDVNQQILEQLVKMNAQLEKTYDKLHSSDWKFWKTMIMIEMIAKENGYEFSNPNNDNKEI